jgi:CubicO group peptidase (beta-lactamase class C family)/predicted aspartyl protease
MKKLIIALALLWTSSAWAISDAEVAAQLEKEVDKAAAQDQFSGVVMLAKDGKPYFAKAWGNADLKGTPNTVDTKFNLGSINKIFTQIAIAQLAAAGKLSTTDTVRKHIPDYPSAVADKITIQQLVDHRAGLGPLFGPEYEKAPPSSLRKLSDFLPLFASKPLRFEPGTDQQYSNEGYIVLGLIIERVSGQSYYDYVRDHIYKPAGMKDTDSYALDAAVPNRATGLTKRGPEGPLPERQPNTATLPGRGSSAGGGYSTAIDLVRFAEALKNNKLTTAKWTGWIFHAPSSEQRSIGIAGGSPGTNASLEMNGSETLVVLSNYDPPAAEAIARAARKLRGGDAPGGVEVRIGGHGRRPEPPGEVLIKAPAELTMTTVGHLPVIEAMVNGKGPFKFVFDTGFGGNASIRSALADELKLPVIGEAASGDPSGKNRQSVKIAQADSIDVGSAHFGEVNVSISDAAGREGIDGIIGLNLFNGLLVTFDFPHSTLKIMGGKLDAGDGVLPYTNEQGVPTIDIDVAGQKMTAHIDSGSPGELTLPLNVAKSLQLGEEPRVVGHARTVNNSFDVYAAPLTGNVRVGDVVLTNPRIDFVDIFPIGNLGSRFLGNLVVTFDPARGRVKFLKP